MPQDVQDFLLREDSQPYLRLAQKAQQLGMDPELLDELFDFLVRFRAAGREVGSTGRDVGLGDLSPYRRERPKG